MAGCTRRIPWTASRLSSLRSASCLWTFSPSEPRLWPRLSLSARPVTVIMTTTRRLDAAATRRVAAAAHLASTVVYVVHCRLPHSVFFVSDALCVHAVRSVVQLHHAHERFIVRGLDTSVTLGDVFRMTWTHEADPRHHHPSSTKPGSENILLTQSTRTHARHNVL